MDAPSAAIRTLERLDEADLHRLAAGYESDWRFRVDVEEGPSDVRWRLVREELAEPFRKRFDPPDRGTLELCLDPRARPFCFGAWGGDRLVGLALAEPMRWNRSLWVRELHMEPDWRRRGLGRALVERLVEAGRAAGLRTVICETQNVNGPALDFYRRAGFRLEGVDLSYYSNGDHPDGEVALFMKRRID